MCDDGTGNGEQLIKTLLIDAAVSAGVAALTHAGKFGSSTHRGVLEDYAQMPSDAAAENVMVGNGGREIKSSNVALSALAQSNLVLALTGGSMSGRVNLTGDGPTVSTVSGTSFTASGGGVQYLKLVCTGANIASGAVGSEATVTINGWSGVSAASMFMASFVKNTDGQLAIESVSGAIDGTVTIVVRNTSASEYTGDFALGVLLVKA